MNKKNFFLFCNALYLLGHSSICFGGEYVTAANELEKYPVLGSNVINKENLSINQGRVGKLLKDHHARKCLEALFASAEFNLVTHLGKSSISLLGLSYDNGNNLKMIKIAFDGASIDSGDGYRCD